MTEEEWSLSEGFRLLRRQFGEITDSRFNRGRVHPLDITLSLTVLGLMCGQRSLSASTGSAIATGNFGACWV